MPRACASVLATCEKAKEKNLSLVSGLCWRYHNGVRETMQRVLDGAIGDIVAMQETYLTGTLWDRPRQPSGPKWSSRCATGTTSPGSRAIFNVEQHVHSLDKAVWAMHDQPPVQAWGLGGRQVRTDAKFGDIYDHHAVVYEYPKRRDRLLLHRQQAGCYSDVSDIFIGTKGRANILRTSDRRLERQSYLAIQGRRRQHVRHRAPGAVCLDPQRARLINNGVYMARSTMLAILGRMVDYTGQKLTWDEAIQSKQVLAPKAYAWDAEPPTQPGKDDRYPVAMPGQTRFV